MNGWTAHEHAVFRGYLDIATKLKAANKDLHVELIESGISPISLNKDKSNVSKSYGHQYMQN